MDDVTLEELAGRLDEEELIVLDVRTRGEYTGDLGAPCDPRQGHIPGAHHLDVAQLHGLSAEQVRGLVGGREGAEVIAYCHSGQRSAHAVALLRLAGYEARNYAGSWHEWSRHASLPVETT
jgi:thiosulfate/3-mercaptopyruvate sulfurtransferase